MCNIAPRVAREVRTLARAQTRPRLGVVVGDRIVASAQQIDQYVLASVNQVEKHDDATGFYATLRLTSLADREEAEAYEKALRRSAYYLHRNHIVPVSMHAAIKRDGAKYMVEFTAINKIHSRNYMLQRYGSDRSKWPYSPRRKN